MESGTIVALVMGICSLIGVGVGYVMRSERTSARIETKLALLSQKLDNFGMTINATDKKVDSWVRKASEHGRLLTELERKIING